MNKYFIEFMGTTTITYAKLLTEGDATVMAIVYFAMLTISKGITTGYFTPAGLTASYLVGRTTQEDFLYNLIAQFCAAVCVAVTFIPIKTYID